MARDKRRLGLRSRLLAEVRGKSFALSCLRGGGGRGCDSDRRRRQTQSLLASKVGLLCALLALQQAVLRL
ncbi:hypothetical protein MTX20_21720 [Bradyrhizobium sp. ISRA435]|nr:hypothetical protein MTX20_21720 [Bradyrhizobium sp. ISRA435]